MHPIPHGWRLERQHIMYVAIEKKDVDFLVREKSRFPS